MMQRHIRFVRTATPWLALLAAAAAFAGEQPELRTPFSRTFLLDNGCYNTHVYSAPIHQRGPSGAWVPIDADSVRNSYPQSEEYWTGNVKFRNADYTKSGGDLYFRGGQASSQDRRQAWAKFDLSPIPDRATLTAVHFYYYCYQIGEMPRTYVRLVTSDPVTANAATLWNDITTGTLVAPDYGHGVGWQTRTLNSTGVAAVQARLVSDWVALGLHEYENQNTNWGYAYGSGGGPGGVYQPYLSIYYSPPPATDVSAEQVIAPTGTIQPGELVVPIGRWRNCQAQATSFVAYFIVTRPGGARVYSESLIVASLAGLRDTALAFPAVTIGTDTGRWTAICSTYATDDINRENDVRSNSFRVAGVLAGRDVGVTEILEPGNWVDTNSVVKPRARWHNGSTTAVDFVAQFSIENPAKARISSQSISVSALAPGADTVLVFEGHNVGVDTGRWLARCSTFTANDTQPANDTMSRHFVVWTGGTQTVTGWKEVAAVPSMPSGKAARDGAWLARDPASGVVYAAKGGGTKDFYCYHPEGDTWVQLAVWPEGSERKAPKKGAVGVADGRGSVYAVKGSNSLGFWRYDIAGDSWTQMRDVPLGPSNKKIKGGSAVVCADVGDVSYVYLLKGYKNEFCRYSTVTDSWEMLTEAPNGANPKWDKGSWLAYDGMQTIYAHKAKRHELWRYDMASGTWSDVQLKSMPYVNRAGKNKKSKDGGSGALADGYIYALKGGNTCEFWRYSLAGDSWAELETIPQFGSTGRKKRVKGGGSLIACSREQFLALKGNKCNEFWQYVPTHEAPASGSIAQTGAQSATSRDARGGRLTLPSHVRAGRVVISLTGPAHFCLSGAVRLTIQDVAGRLVRSGVFDQRGEFVLDLPTGIFLLQLQAGDEKLTRKLVVLR